MHNNVQRFMTARLEQLLISTKPRNTVRAALRLMWLATSVPRIVPDVENTQIMRHTARRPSWPILTFIVFVVIPSFISQFYLIFVAADQYVAEARFAVRIAEVESPTDILQSAISAFGASPSTSTPSSQNAYIVTSYIRSRAMIDDITKAADLREIFRRPEADFWSRLRSSPSVEELLKYWLHMVDCYVDAPSGIVKLQVRAFRKDDAVTIANAALSLSEKLVNVLSNRARADAMKMAEQEVRRADGLVRGALSDLRRYRDSEGLIDPVKAADETDKLLAQLLTERVQIESELFVATRSLARDAPTVQNLRNRLDSVEAQIIDLKSKLTGNSLQSRNLAGALAQFEALELQRQFAEKLYSMAQDGLERARMLAERQSTYLTVFVPPSKPEEASFPRRIGYSLAIPLVLMIFWGIGALISASIEDHRL
jgi:capsular polysaccharide transport system permease protein